jgi:nucleotide-binding universal stress UspA family protein
VAQSYGVGTFEANTVMLGWPSRDERAEDYLQMLRDLTALDRSLLIVRHNAERERGQREDIHVWWGGFKGNGGMMLLLAFLLKADLKWRRAKVTVLTVVDDEVVQKTTEAALREVLDGVRLDATPRVLLRGGRPIMEVIEQESRTCDLAIVGMRMPDEGEPAQAFFAHNRTLLARLPTTILVHSARHFEGEPVLLDA